MGREYRDMAEHPFLQNYSAGLSVESLKLVTESCKETHGMLPSVAVQAHGNRLI
jgi:hypothetical protein